MNKRIPRKSGQPAKSDKHSDLYTDEDPKGTIHGLKFATPEDAKTSVSKIKSSGRSHAHKIQAAIAMEQRAKVMGKAGAAAVYRSFINSMKDKTEDMKEDWSQKYKKSIDCSNPKGFSQRAHCQGRKKKMKEHIEEAVKMTALEKFRKAAAEREKKHAEIEKKQSKDGSGLTAAIDRLEKHVNKEDAPTNAAGTGAIAGLGVGPQGEPGVNMKKKKKVIPFAMFTRKMPN